MICVDKKRGGVYDNGNCEHEYIHLTGFSAQPFALKAVVVFSDARKMTIASITYTIFQLGNIRGGSSWQFLRNFGVRWRALPVLK